MCLITKNTLRVTDRNIKVKKIFEIKSDHLINWCQHQYIDSTELIPDIIGIPEIYNNGNLCYERGFIHGFTEESLVYAKYCSDENFASFMAKNNWIFLDCMIPVGTEFVTDDGFIASRKMIITDPKFDSYVSNR